jgi:ABC-2 type transport system permease protein
VLQDQVATVVVLLVYLFVIENILTNVPALDRWTPYLTGQAEEALVGSTLPDPLLLEPWQGGLLLAGYAIALGWVGTALAVPRDLT